MVNLFLKANIFNSLTAFDYANIAGFTILMVLHLYLTYLTKSAYPKLIKRMDDINDAKRE